MKHILLWCSPGFGVLDIWLPIVRKLKEEGNVRIDFVFPEPSSLLLESKDSDLFNFAEQFSDEVIFRGYSGRFFIEPTLVKARTRIKFSKVYEKITQLSLRLTKGRASKYFVLKKLGEYISIVSRFVIYVEEYFESPNLYDMSLLDNVDGILCDITKEGKILNKELKYNLKHVHKYSMLHGLAATWVLDELTCKDPVPKRSDVTVYSMSNLELDGYKKCFGILEKNIIHAGIPRHDNDWIEFISKQTNYIESDVFDSFVFIIGRPASPYNTVERKLKALKDIYDIVCIKCKLKLVVKTHPKESADESVYIEALGLENYGKTWMYSDSHPFILGKKAIFCISFYSGVILDMLAINKPTIEYLDLEGLKSYDNSDSLRDMNGKPVFQYRYTNLVLGASNKIEFETHVDSILNKTEETVSSLRLRYEEYFSPFDEASAMIADNIYKGINS